MITAESPAEEVLAYHLWVYIDKLGFDEFDAVALADSEVDWHQVERMVKAGCPHELILQICL